MIVLAVVCWLLSGLVGSALVQEFGARRAGLDITVADIAVGCVMALFGPCTMLVALFAGGAALCMWLFNMAGADRVVFRGVRK
jgi:hypothetical protein